MKRSELRRSTPLRAKAPMERKSRLGSGSSLPRKPIKRKKRKPKPGDDFPYKAFVKAQPCCVGGWKCGKSDPHHLIDGKGEARKGMGQTAPDRFLLPMCRSHHDQFHAGKGFCFGWDKAQRLTYQEQEIERLRSIWEDYRLLGVLQEPERRRI